jgi:hypothetical protein
MELKLCKVDRVRRRISKPAAAAGQGCRRRFLRAFNPPEICRVNEPDPSQTARSFGGAQQSLDAT